MNQLHADSSERFEVARSSSEIRVNGIVETVERKRQLETALHQVPHVTPVISTFQEVEKRPATNSEITSVQAASSIAQRSPLETFLLEKGKSRDQVTELSQQLLNAAVGVEQHSKALADLLKRFPPDAQMSETARTAFDELVEHHKVALVTELQQEEHYITEVAASSTAQSSKSTGDLITNEKRNMNLCVELTSGSDQTRSAETIVPELATSIARLREVVLSIQANSETPGNFSSLLRTSDTQH